MIHLINIQLNDLKSQVFLLLSYGEYFHSFIALLLLLMYCFFPLLLDKDVFIMTFL